MSKQDTWNKLRPNLQIIINDFEQGIDPKRYMEIYTMIYDHCVKSSTTEQKSGASFAGEDIYTEFRRYIENEVDILCKQADSYLGESLLEFYNKRWTKYTLSAQVINHLFQYLNRHWIKRKIEEGRKDVYEIYTLFLVTWRDKFLGNQSAKASKAILSLIERERNGESINTSLVQGVIKSFVELGVEMSTNSASLTDASLTVYTKHFEAPFIEDSKNYYTLESSKFLSENSVTLYIKKVEQRLKEEENRVKMYLHESTLSKIIQECETQLIEKHKDAITEECKKFFESHSIEDFGRVYNLLSRISKGLDSLRLDFEKHVKEDGLKSVAPITEGAENDPKPYVESLLGVHRKYHEVVVQAFKNDSGFIASLDRACREFVNRNSVCGNSPTKSPELLARFCDNILKKSAKTPEENELEETLKGVMVIFKYLEDKDVFQRFYSKMLAKRLVHGQSVSEDSEESMISKLKEACGYEYTTKLHRMFNDVQTSKDLTREFKDKVSSSEDGDIPSDITLLVLCTGSWPLSASNTPFTLPQELQKSVNKFQMYYQNKHSGRKLNWLYHMSKGEVKTNYTKSSFFFQVSAYQIGILLQYNSAEVYTVEDLMNNTQLTEDITKQILEIFSKARILIAEGPEGALSTKYRLNTDFKSKKIRVNLNMPLKVEKKQEDEETKKHIEEDRKMLIQAAAVRVMKTRKQLKHVELMNEIISQLQNRFKPSVPDIKKCIDILIEKDYLERVDGERDTYSYVA